MVTEGGTMYLKESKLNDKFTYLWQFTTAMLPSVHRHSLRDQCDQLGYKVLMYFACSGLWLVLVRLVIVVPLPHWWWHRCGGHH